MSDRVAGFGPCKALREFGVAQRGAVAGDTAHQRPARLFAQVGLARGRWAYVQHDRQQPDDDDRPARIGAGIVAGNARVVPAPGPFPAKRYSFT